MKTPQSFKIIGFPNDPLQDQHGLWFDKVADPDDWRNPIEAIILASEYKEVNDAVVFFTGTSLAIKKQFMHGNKKYFHVSSEGYRLGPCG